MNRTLVVLAGLVPLCAGGLASAQPVPAQPAPAGPPVIVVTGQATVRQPPDRAFVTLATETRAPRPQEAQQKNAGAMAAVRQKLADAKLPPDAVRTVAYSLQEESDWVNGKRVPRGYVAVNTIEIRLDDILRVGEIVDLAVSAGAGRVNDIRFGLKDRAAAERQALRLAVADARARAEAVAAGGGLTLGSVLRVEGTTNGGEPPRPIPMMAMRAQVADAPPTPVSAGEIEIEATATLTVGIR